MVEQNNSNHSQELTKYYKYKFDTVTLINNFIARGQTSKLGHNICTTFVNDTCSCSKTNKKRYSLYTPLG